MGDAVQVRVVFYERVSTDGQVTDGYGLDVQDDSLHAWARAGKHRVVAVCVDAGRSGAGDTLERDGLAEAFGHVLAGRADAVAVHRLDRLARDMVLQEQLLADLQRLGAALHSMSPTEDAALVDDPEDPTRALVRRILGAVAQHEREVIRLRLRAGAAKRLAATGYAGGKPPFGWRSAPGGKGLVQDDGEQLVLARIFELHGQGLSYRAIGEQLSSEGMRPRSQAAIWRPGSIRLIILRGTGQPDYRKPSTPSHATA